MKNMVFLFWVVGTSINLLKEVIARYLLRRAQRGILIALETLNAYAVAMRGRAHKEKFSGVHDDLFQYHHKRKSFRRIHD